jgi:VIT1/CCC1 family predicted Fe2+/Mn2+ transporter
MNRLIHFVVAVAVVGILALVLRWLMGALEIGPPVDKIIWVVFVLLALIGIAGLFGYGPFRTGWYPYRD